MRKLCPPVSRECAMPWRAGQRGRGVCPADAEQGECRQQGQPAELLRFRTSPVIRVGGTSTGAGSRPFANPPYMPLSAVVPRHQIQMRPAHLFDVGSRQADIGEQMVIKFE